jgi:glycosyltransferase involved in cell wall biosynthesis
MQRNPHSPRAGFAELRRAGVITEATALRRPIISTFITGIPALVVPGEHGLAPNGDTPAIGSATRAFLNFDAARMGRPQEARAPRRG